ncbi:MAG TPA: CotH kinase family protein [Thermoguttaceae bacterium]|nr:CotH kinase family protein [Thermoguttaceae bacterium]
MRRTNSPDAGFVEAVEQVIDLEQWLRFLALDTLMLNTESGLNLGVGDDYMLYSGEEDPRFILVPHDLDTVMWQGNDIGNIEQSIFTFTEVAGLGRLLTHPDVTPRYYAAIVDLIDTVFNPEVISPLLHAKLDDVVPPSRIAQMEDFVTKRTEAVLAQIPTEFTVADDRQLTMTVRDGYRPGIPILVQADAIDTRHVNATIERYIVRDFFDKGISVAGDMPNDEIHLNYILSVDNGIGISAKSWKTGHTKVFVDHVTVVGNDVGIQARDKLNAPNVLVEYFITNSIVWGNGVEVTTDWDPADLHIDYSNVDQAWPGGYDTVVPRGSARMKRPSCGPVGARCEGTAIR